jgi:hypothetical protein
MKIYFKLKSRLIVATAIATMLLLAMITGTAAETNVVSDVAAYNRTINERAEKIVATLNVEDLTKSTRVRDVITQQYRDLAKIHEARDVKIAAAKQENTSTNKASVDGEIKATQAETKVKLDQLHTKFLDNLSSELSPAQVEKVKDGLTYGVVPLTYGVYLKMYPDLTGAQRKQIMTWLVEARELAMDEGSSKEKHGVFGKYKGRINNYLSAAGYDAKKAEQNLKDSNALVPKKK